MDTKVLKSMLNPVRMRILQVMGRNDTTTQEIMQKLGDIPQASLYRHIKAMLKDEVIQVVDEVQKRGTLEKVYRLRENPFKAIDEAVANKDRDALYGIFYTFVMTNLMDFNDYLNQEDFDLVEDRVGFRSFPLYLTNEECQSFAEDIRQVITKYSSFESQASRSVRKFTYMLMPGDE